MQVPYHFEEETEYFEFIPSSFTDEIVNLVNEEVYGMVEKLQTELTTLYPQMTQSQLEQGIQNMLNLFESHLDRNFDILELYLLRNIFRFPGAFHIPRPQVNEDVSQLQAIEEELKSKKSRLIAAEVFQRELENEIANEESTLEGIQKFYDQLSLLYSSLNGKSFDATVTDLSGQIETLKNIVIATFESSSNLSKPISHSSDESLKEFNALLQQKEMIQLKLKEEKTELCKISDPDVLVTLKNLVA